MRKPAPQLIWNKPFWACSACAWKELQPKPPVRFLNYPEPPLEIVGSFLEHRCARYPREHRNEVIP